MSASRGYEGRIGRYGPELAIALTGAAAVRTGQRALDVGCGTGALTSRLVELLGPGNVSAVDPDPDALEICRARLPAVDARLAAAESLPFRDGEFDVVFSNSVIEHVGGHERRQRFADAVHQLSDAHWIQTPYRYFPIEPHWMAPGMQFLPVAARARLVRHWPLAYLRGKSPETVLRRVLQVELIGRTQFRYYFPDSVIRAETVLGVPKSLIAYRTGSGRSGASEPGPAR
jgi:SAM-dependent methyltransferase